MIIIWPSARERGENKASYLIEPSNKICKRPLAAERLAIRSNDENAGQNQIQKTM
jgi:hypothetical protein